MFSFFCWFQKAVQQTKPIQAKAHGKKTKMCGWQCSGILQIRFLLGLAIQGLLTIAGCQKRGVLQQMPIDPASVSYEWWPHQLHKVLTQPQNLLPPKNTCCNCLDCCTMLQFENGIKIGLTSNFFAGIV